MAYNAGDVERISRELRIALANAFAPKIDDEEAMKFHRALMGGVLSETDMGLKSVPIGICYMAMLEFRKMEVERTNERLRKIVDKL